MKIVLRGTFIQWVVFAILTSSSVSAQRPELVVQRGPGAADSLAFSPDGKTLASTGGSVIELWEVASGRELRIFAGHKEAVLSVAFSSDGRTLASGGYDSTVKLWDVATGHELRTLMGHSGWVASVALSPDGRILASGSNDHTIKVWDVASGRELFTLSGHDETITSVVFSPDGHTLASGSLDATVKLWDMASGQKRESLSTDIVLCMAFSPDGRTLASGTFDEKINLWDLSSGNAQRSLVGHTHWVESDKINSVAFSPDGKILASGNLDNTIKLWDVTSGQELRTLTGHGTWVKCVVFSPDGRTLASGGYDSTIKLWDVEGWNEVRTLARHSAWARSLAFSPDGRTVALSDNKNVKVWDIESGRGPRRLGEHDFEVRTVLFSPDGQMLVSAGDYKIKLWDLARGRQLSTAKLGTLTVSSLAISPDGSILAAGTQGGGLKLWHLNSGTYWWGKEDTMHYVNAVAFSPDGRTLASAAGNTIKLWDVESESELHSLEGHSSWVDALAFSPDGRTLASAAQRENTIKIWDTASGAELRALSGHRNEVYCLQFSPDGRTLASGSMDGTVRLWDMASGVGVQTLEGHSSNSLAFSPDGRRLVSASGDGAVTLWDVGTKREVASLVAFDNGDWIMTDSEGRFDTNNLDEIKSFSWVFPSEPFRALAPEIFMRDYYQPKLLPRLLAGERLPAVRPLSDLSRVQPTVQIVRVEAEGALASVTVKVTSTRSQVQKAADGKYLESGVFDLRLFQDGRLVGQWPEAQDAEGTGRTGSAGDLETWRRLHEIKLLNGEYSHTFHHVRLPRRAGVDKVAFTSYAFNSDRVKSLTTGPLEYVIPKASGEQGVGVGRRAYLISMGVNANQSRWNLDFAVPSAQDAAHLLSEKLAKDYEIVDISLFSTLAPDSPRVLLQQATKANLKAVLDLLAGKPIDDTLRDSVDPNHRIQPATPDDAVVLSISSHGYADPLGTFYVVPYDTGAAPGVTEELLTRCESHAEDRSLECARANAFLEHTISSREFAAWWAGVDAGEMMMILDACHSAAAPGREFRPGPLGDAGLGQLSYDKGMRILTATQPDKTARATLVEELGHSLLVQALLEEAKAHPHETLAQWLHDTEQQVPVLTHRLYPELREADVQLPELFDFSVTERHQTHSRSADAQQ